MDGFLDFFENIPTWFRMLILIGGLIFFWAFEGLIPLFPKKYKKYKHAGLNLILTAFNSIIALSFAGLLIATSLFVNEKELGLIHWLNLPLWANIIIGVLILDFTGAFLIHWIEHKVKWMWKFHIIHHSDTNVDVTTGLRHHPGEFVFRMTFTVLGVALSGASIVIIMIYQTLSALFTHLTHANIDMGKVDKILSYIFVTPNMHKMHHHYKLPLTDRNFGNIFSIWDRVLGTFIRQDKVKNITYGIDTHIEQKEHENLGNLLKIPFQKYRAPQGEEKGDW